eukprot:PhF_6_TR2200/c0_g1_i9/m.3655
MSLFAPMCIRNKITLSSVPTSDNNINNTEESSPNLYCLYEEEQTNDPLLRPIYFRVKPGEEAFGKVIGHQQNTEYNCHHHVGASLSTTTSSPIVLKSKVKNTKYSFEVYSR